MLISLPGTPTSFTFASALHYGEANGTSLYLLVLIFKCQGFAWILTFDRLCTLFLLCSDIWEEKQ